MLSPLPPMHTSDAPMTSSVPRAVKRSRRLIDRSGPYTSVCMATRPGHRDAAADLSNRWTQVRSDLETAGAPGPAIAAIEARLHQPMPVESRAIAVVAAADGVSVVAHSCEPPTEDSGAVAPLPKVARLFG